MHYASIVGAVTLKNLPAWQDKDCEYEPQIGDDIRHMTTLFLACLVFGWFVGRLVGWLVGRSVGRSVGRLLGRSVGRSVGRLFGWFDGDLDKLS